MAAIHSDRLCIILPFILLVFFALDHRAFGSRQTVACVVPSSDGNVPGTSRFLVGFWFVVLSEPVILPCCGYRCATSPCRPRIPSIP